MNSAYVSFHNVLRCVTTDCTCQTKLPYIIHNKYVFVTLIQNASMPNTVFCPHCQCQVPRRTYFRHKALYLKNGRWSNTLEQKRPSGSCFREKYHKGCSRQLPANIETIASTILDLWLCDCLTQLVFGVLKTERYYTL